MLIASLTRRRKLKCDNLVKKQRGGASVVITLSRVQAGDI